MHDNRNYNLYYSQYSLMKRQHYFIILIWTRTGESTKDTRHKRARKKGAKYRQLPHWLHVDVVLLLIR